MLFYSMKHTVTDYFSFGFALFSNVALMKQSGRVTMADPCERWGVGSIREVGKKSLIFVWIDGQSTAYQGH